MKNYKNYKKYILAVLIGCSVALLSAQSRGTPSQIRINVDANGYLVVSSAAQVSPISTVQFSNARLSVDASGNLLVAASSGSGFAPADATYITQTTNAILTAEQALGSLSSGLLAVTTTTGVIASIAHVATDQFLISTGTGTVPAWNSQITYGSSVLKVNGASPVTGTAGSIYIGNSSPDTTGVNTAGSLYLQAANGNSSQTVSTSYGSFPAMIYRRANNTFASPTALATDDIIGGFAGRGWGDAFLSGSDVAINFKASQTFTATHHGTYITFETTPTDSTTRAIRWRIEQDGTLNPPSATAGVINASSAGLTIKTTTSGSVTLTPVTSLIFNGSVTPAATGVRFVCISTAGVIQSQAAACVGT